LRLAKEKNATVVEQLLGNGFLLEIGPKRSIFSTSVTMRSYIMDRI